MLSRTADHLYWMSRYVERAETLARLIDAQYRLSLLPRTADAIERALGASLRALSMHEAYRARHSALESRRVLEFVTLDRDHPGSIFNCLRAARENARAVRGALTSELWETLNATWLDARSLWPGQGLADVGVFVEWVKERSHLTRGVMVGTMLRDEAFHFSRIGAFLERADSTARILIAYQSDLRPGAPAGAVPDPYEWSVLLRSLSAFEVYRRVYRDVITPFRVAQLLILQEDMPRSLLRCCKELYGNLRAVRNEQSHETERRAGELHAQLHFNRMETLIAEGLPHFVQQFLGRLHDLGERIASDFLVASAEA